MAAIEITDLTTSEVEGTGVFDKLMKSMVAHITVEYDKNRIRGPEYSQVYLSGLQTTMQQSIQFLMERENALLTQKQVELAQKQIEIAEKDLLLKDKELIQSDKAIELADKNIALTQAQIDKLLLEAPLVDAQRRMIEAQILNVPKEGQLLDEKINQATSETALVDQKVINAVTEELVLQGQKCKLDAEYALLVVQKARVINESSLIVQKILTETAQTSGANIDADSVLGRQIALLQRQADGFIRDAEQKSAKIVADLYAVNMGVTETASSDDVALVDDIKSIILKLKNTTGSA